MKTKRFFASLLTLVLLLSCVNLTALAANTESDSTQEDALVLKKQAVAQSDGTYKITLEAYAKGEVQEISKTVPMDVVLVLDQSGSMAYDFKGNNTSDNSKRRQTALKGAVNSFIEEVNKKYSDDADHRMAIVTFGTQASTLVGWTNVNDNGAKELKNKINRLPSKPEGATRADLGMSQANGLFSASYTGNNTANRQKVVIFFTDGVPTSEREFETNIADSAISTALSMKNSGVTVYSIGIFEGANPNQLYGEKWAYATVDDISCDGNVGSYWGGSWAASIGGDVEAIDIPAGNRFLNYISTNSSNAEGIGITRDTFHPGHSSIIYNGTGYRIDNNYSREKSTYYLTANNAGSLSEIFTTISDNISSTTVQLDNNAVVKDTISEYFDAPAGANEINVFTAVYQGDEKWGERVKDNSITAQCENSQVSVTGFNFAANCVTEKENDNHSKGKKLIIEFTVTPKESFLGGNDVFTNTDAGIYENSTAEKPIMTFDDKPTVNVPIKNVTVNADDKNVYLKGEVAAAQLQEGAVVKVGNVKLDLSKADQNYGLKDWQTEYVNINVAVKDKDGKVISGNLNDLTEDTTYTIEVTVKPKYAGLPSSSGTPATEQPGENPPANINVFKPELTFKDSTAYYGANVPANNDYSNNKVGEEKWMHNGKAAVPSEMLGKAPKLDISYKPNTGKLDNGKYTKQDIPVSATVMIGTEDVKEHTKFVHDTCTEDGCSWKDPTTTPGNPAFLIHVKTCTLKIQKTGGAGDESYVFDVYKDGKKYSEVTIWGNDTATLYELPVGTYTIKENEGWSWRYTVDNGGSAVLSAENHEGEIICNNTMNKKQWLNGFSEVHRNIFGMSNSSN